MPLLRASGGVAAAVGAFLVRHPTAESRMLIWFRLRPREITALAFVMVGLWLGIADSAPASQPSPVKKLP